MSYLSNKVGILKDVFMGNLMKFNVRYDIRLRKSIKLSPQQDNSVIVSLTSYGERVRGSVVYSVYSLLRQTVRAERVVLWLDEKAYNSDNLPSDLRFLCRFGLEIRFGKDIRSYTKIIHSLKAFPDKHIITADDDIFYTKTFLKEFIEAHRQHQQAIITSYAKVPVKGTNSQLAPYYDWPEYHHVTDNFKYDQSKLFPLGWAGVFYPSNIFDNEVFNEAVFTDLCPQADDVWLYVMGLRNKAEKRMLTNSRISHYHTDLVRQYFTKDRLTVQNRLKGENDVQLQAVLDYYEVSI